VSFFRAALYREYFVKGPGFFDVVIFSFSSPVLHELRHANSARNTEGRKSKREQRLAMHTGRGGCWGGWGGGSGPENYTTAKIILLIITKIFISPLQKKSTIRSILYSRNMAHCRSCFHPAPPPFIVCLFMYSLYELHDIFFNFCLSQRDLKLSCIISSL
jgi:hypothetical protein